MKRPGSQIELRTLFTCRNIRLGNKDRPRLEIQSLQIPYGRTAILGYSGAGKTSLLNLLSGFEEPDTGSVSHSGSGGSGSDGTDEDAPRRVSRFWVPENGGFWSHLTARQHLDFVAPSVQQHVASGHASADSRNIGQPDDSSDELLKRLDLSHRSDARPAEMSQGERSRLAVARAMATEAAVLIMDEPLAHVDLARKHIYWDVVLNHVQEKQVSMVFSSHEPEIVLRAAEHVVCLENGQVTFQGETATLFESPQRKSTAQLLGPVNWFDDSSEFQHWMSSETAQGQAVRPVFVDVGFSDDSPLHVEHVIDCGLYCETRVAHRELKSSRTVAHRHGPRMPRPGDSVIFRVRRDGAHSRDATS